MSEVLSDGEHREYYEDRSLKAVYTIKNGKKNGTYTEYHQNSDRIKLTEEYLDGKLHGKRKGSSVDGRETYEQGSLIERRWSDNRYETYKNGELYHKVHRIDSHHHIDMYYKDGKEYDGEYCWMRRVGGRDGDDYEHKYTIKEGKYHGKYIDEYNQVMANYNMGVLHGKYQAKEKDGGFKDGYYNQGKFNGSITSKDEETVETWSDGNLELITNYACKRGFYGDISSKKVVSEIRPNGICVEYENGRIVKKYEQKNGQKEGKYEEFDPRGWLRSEATYKNGKLNGFVKEYNSDGTVASRSYYKDGENLTSQRKILEESAQKHVSSVEGVSPKQSKLQKTILAMKMKAASFKR